MNLKKHISKFLSQKFHSKIAHSKKCITQNYSFKKHTSKLLPQKMHFNIAITKIFFMRDSINAVKDKIDKDKSLVMHD